MSTEKKKILSTFDQLISTAESRYQNIVNDPMKGINWEGFEIWRQASIYSIEMVFGKESRHLAEFLRISFSPADPNSPEQVKVVVHMVGLRRAKESLFAMKYTLENLLPNDEKQLQAGPIQPVIFIAHGGVHSNIKLEKTKSFLNALGAIPVIVEDLPNLGLDVNAKVQYYLGQCNSGIAIVTAEDSLMDGQVQGRPNIIHEIGLMQQCPTIGNKIVILKQAEVNLPSNIRNLGYIEFSKKSMDSAFTGLVKDLRGFGFFW